MAYHRALPHVNDRVGLYVMTAFFFVTACLSFALRLYSRRLCRLDLGADDWFALVSFILVLGLNGTFLGGLIQGPITGHSVVVDNWPQHSPLEVLAQKYKYAFQIIEKLAFGTIKISILFLWKRILSPVRSFQLFCWVMIGIVAAWSILFFFATLFQCGINWDWNWAPIGFFLTECTDTLNMLTVFTGTDLLTDFVIMFMPVPVVWRLKMPTVKKIGVSWLFMVGIFTIGAGIARMYIYLVTSYDKMNNLDFIADFTLFILWSEIEVNVAMVVCCMPTFGPVIAHIRDRVYRRFGISTRDSTKFSGSQEKEIAKKNLTSISSVTYTEGDHENFVDQPQSQSQAPWRGEARTWSCAGQSHRSMDIEAGQRDGRILVHTEITSGNPGPGEDLPEQICTERDKNEQW